LPPSGVTLNTNYNSIEILTTKSPSYIFQTYLQTFEGAWPGNNDVATVPNTTNITGTGQNLQFTLESIFASKPLVWLGLGQGPFSVQTERFDTTANAISAVTLQGHPLAGWRYWRVYSVGTNDLVIETGAADVSAADNGDQSPDAYIDLSLLHISGQANKDMAGISAVHSE
jgi:hypothetical protein